MVELKPKPKPMVQLLDIFRFNLTPKWHGEQKLSLTILNPNLKAFAELF